MSKYFLMVFVGMCCAAAASGQTRYLYVHDYVLGVTDSLVVLEGQEWKSASTPWHVGALPGRDELPTELPHDSLLRGKTLRISPAKDYLNTLTYPARCAAALRVLRNDTVRPSCSSMMVGNRWAITAAHCLMSDVFKPSFNQREVRVYPAWDDGRLATEAPYSRVVRAYYFGEPQSDVLNNDVALLELETPVGDVVGWVGLHTTPDTAWPSSVLGHRLSYPAARSYEDTNIVYDGAILSYRYGIVERYKLIAYSVGTRGVLGESGGSVLISDNGGYSSVGVNSTGVNINARLLDSTTFEVFRNLILTTSDVRGRDANTTGLAGNILFYPNPVEDILHVVLRNEGSTTVESADIYDLMGRHVAHFTSASIACANLPSGTYSIVVTSGSVRAQTLFVKR